MDPGRRLGHYDIQAKLGAGGMGTVYLALDTRLNRLVALKVLAPDRWEGTAGRGRLIREAQAASALNHPNIVTVYEVGHEADVDFIAMERVDGKTLRNVIEHRPPMREMLPIAMQVAGAIAAAHAAGIVHRDLKPSNIMVTERGLVKILDFGIAKVAAGRLRIQPHADAHPTRPDSGHGGLYVARTGGGQGCGLAVGYLFLWLRAL